MVALLTIIMQTFGYYFIVIILCVSAVSASYDSLVEVAQGWLQGELLEAVTGDMYYYSFKGIPYAEAPVGDLRFKAPQPPVAWSGVKNATVHGSVCPHVNIFNYSELIPGNEDCLFLNVYTPDLNPETPFPVMMFIHGGGYMSGSGDEDNYGPDFLVRKNVTLVTINYRLDAPGFICMENDEVPGNAGMKDQVAALEWVQNNIAAFGGNPDMVTIFGQSAGSASVAYHILSPRSKGLFHRAIMMSGVPFCDFSYSFQPRRRAFALGKLLGNDTKNETELLQFLRSVDAVDLVGTASEVLASEDIVSNFVKLFPFVPVVEKNGSDSFLTEEPSVLLDEGRINEVDVMFGHTDQETLTGITEFVSDLIARYHKYAELVVPTKILLTSDPKTILELSDNITDFYFGNTTISTNNMGKYISYMNNASFVYDIHRFFGKFPKLANNSIFFYILSSLSSRNVYGNQGAEYGLTGAGHLDDCMYLFDAKLYNLTIETNSTEFALVDQATTVFTNFAKYGNPSPNGTAGVSWPQYDNETSCYVNIGSNLTVACEPDKEDVEFWKGILEYANITF